MRALVLALLLVVGCTAQQQGATQGGVSLVAESGFVPAPVSSVVDIEVLLDRDAPDEYYEYHCDDTNDPDYGNAHSADKPNPQKCLRLEDKVHESLFPLSYSVNQGDTVRLVFLMQYPHTIYIEGFGVYEQVQNDAILFVADRPGRFPIYCLDCSNNDVAELLVI